MDVKQVIVVRRDLNMRKGKMCAQVAHASTAFLRNECIVDDVSSANPQKYNCWFSEEEAHWFTTDYRKVVVWVRTEQELLDLYEKACEHCSNVELQYDNGATEFYGERTLTCLAIGPDLSPNVDIVTGHLPLL